MTDFVVDLNRYLKELASTQDLIKEAATASKNSTPSASSSPLTKEEEITLERTDIWWTSSNHNASLSRDHPHYHETCFQCRKLGHIRVDCSLYKCPTCFKWSPRPRSSLLPSLTMHPLQASIFFLVLQRRTLSSSPMLLPHGHYQTSPRLSYLVGSPKPFLIPDLRR